jgi:hypothetical protein
MSAEQASDLLYPFLFEGGAYDRRQVFATLRKVATPETILATAFCAYRVDCPQDSPGGHSLRRLDGNRCRWNSGRWNVPFC